MSPARIQLSTLDDLFPSFEIESRAFGLIEEFSPNIGLSAALTVAKLKVLAWEVAKSEMVRQRDPRLVYLANFDTAVLDIVVPISPSDAAANTRLETTLQSLFTRLPVDTAALVALIIAERAASRAERSEL
jgi:hypothetical protein